MTAFLILTLIASLDPNSDGVMEQSDIWKQTLDSGCPFYDPASISKLADSVCELLVVLCQNLLLLHVSHVDNTPGKTIILYLDFDLFSRLFGVHFKSFDTPLFA